MGMRNDTEEGGWRCGCPWKCGAHYNPSHCRTASRPRASPPIPPPSPSTTNSSPWRESILVQQRVVQTFSRRRQPRGCFPTSGYPKVGQWCSAWVLHSWASSEGSGRTWTKMNALCAIAPSVPSQRHLASRRRYNVRQTQQRPRHIYHKASSVTCGRVVDLRYRCTSRTDWGRPWLACPSVRTPCRPPPQSDWALPSLGPRLLVRRRAVLEWFSPTAGSSREWAQGPLRPCTWRRPERGSPNIGLDVVEWHGRLWQRRSLSDHLGEVLTSQSLRGETWWRHCSLERRSSCRESNSSFSHTILRSCSEADSEPSLLRWDSEENSANRRRSKRSSSLPLSQRYLSEPSVEWSQYTPGWPSPSRSSRGGTAPWWPAPRTILGHELNGNVTITAVGRNKQAGASVQLKPNCR